MRQKLCFPAGGKKPAGARWSEIVRRVHFLYPKTPETGNYRLKNGGNTLVTALY